MRAPADDLASELEVTPPGGTVTTHVEPLEDPGSPADIDAERAMP